MSSTNTSFIPAFARNLNAKMAEAQGGGYSLNSAEKSAIAEEFGRMSREVYMRMWDAIPAFSVDRQRLMGLLCACCTPDVAATIMHDFVYADALIVATQRVNTKLSERLDNVKQAEAQADRIRAEAEAERTLAREERREAVKLLEEARMIRCEALDAADYANVRRQLQEANSRLDAITAALAR